MRMNTQEVFISNKIHKKAFKFFKMVVKKLFSLQNVMKKLFEMHFCSDKRLFASPKYGKPQ